MINMGTIKLKPVESWFCINLNSLWRQFICISIKVLMSVLLSFKMVFIKNVIHYYCRCVWCRLVYVYTCAHDVHVWTCMPPCMYGGQRTTLMIHDFFFYHVGPTDWPQFIWLGCKLYCQRSCLANLTYKFWSVSFFFNFITLTFCLIVKSITCICFKRSLGHKVLSRCPVLLAAIKLI